MGDQEHTRPPSAPGSVPSKKISISSDNSDYDEETIKKRNLQIIQRKAFCSVLYAFKAETFTASCRKARIIGKLMTLWNIPQDFLDYYTLKIEMGIMNHECYEEIKMVDRAALSQVRVPKPGSSWSRADAESLIWRIVKIRLPDEDFVEYVIKEYDAKEEMHSLESTNPDAMEMDDCFSLIDLREIPPKDIMWP